MCVIAGYNGIRNCVMLWMDCVVLLRHTLKKDPFGIN